MRRRSRHNDDALVIPIEEILRGGKENVERGSTKGRIFQVKFKNLNLRRSM